MDKNGILEITKTYPKNLSELYKKITTAKSAGDEHKLLLDFAEMFSAYLVGFLLGEYRKSKEIVEKIEIQLYINKKAKLSFGIYISYLRELSQSLSDSLLKEKLNKKKNYENSAKLKLNFEEFKKIHKEGLPEKFTEEVGKRLKGRNPSKVNLVESFDLLTQIRNRYAHAADYNWPLGDEYYNWLNPLLSETISELVTDFELLRSYKIVRLQEIGQDEKKYIFQNLESTGEEILEVSVSQDMESQLIENKCYFLDENNNLLMRYFQNELPLPDRNVAEKLEGEEKYKLIEPVLIPTIEERLEDDDMIDNEEYAQLMDIAINAGVEEDKLKKLIYKVAKDKGIVGDPLLMEKAIILNLVEKFEVKKKYYTSNEYNETQLRIEFLDLFFEALGWDVFNKKRTNEVTRELTVRTQAGRATRVDYAFYLGNKEKFFVEAKDATVNLKSDPKPALQLRRYSWNKGLPIGVVSNFREFAIYDCRQQPDEEKDSAKTGLLFYCTNEEYNEKWEEILKLLSKKAVQDGSIDQFSDKHKVTLQTVDQAFLADMEKWRELLANDLAANNSDLLEDLGGLNYAVQMTIDRLVFLRIAEDRESEPTEQLARISKENDIYASLVKLYHQADDKYNSGFFHFKEEKGRENPDDFTINLKISNECLKEIIDNLYSRPYDFSALPAEILGKVYEQFLGKVIIVQDGKVTIEEKPEVKKAGGVYYTPAYIVDYIVENTVGKLLDGKEPKDVENLSILDPACGSGSFLIRAYQYMMDWHLEWYKNNHPEKYSKSTKSKPAVVYLGSEGENNWRLTIDEKKRILMNNIYGVDIDDKAVEVTKLSLLLKVMEGKLSEDPQLQMFHERILPDLSSNIKCGNSLIGSDIFDQEDMQGLSRTDKRRINAFDWEDEFPDIMKNGGFDAVIGNPPYGAELSVNEKQHLESIYSSFEYQINSFILFVEKGLKLLKDSKVISYITPAVFLSQHYFRNVREFILKNSEIEKILLLNYKVFKDADIGDTCVFILRGNQTISENHYCQFTTIKNEILFGKEELSQTKQSEFLKNPRFEINIILGTQILSKLQNISVPLKDIITCIVGIKPYQTNKGKPKQTAEDVKNRSFDSEEKLDDDYKQYLIGKDIDRYDINPLKKRYIKYGIWLAEPRLTAPFEKEKIILRQTSDMIRATLDKNKFYNLNNIYNMELIDTNYNYKYILGILNSKLMVFIYQMIVPEKGKLFAEVKKVNLDKIPIRNVNFEDKNFKPIHDRLCKMVEQMLALNKEKQTTRNPRDLKEIEREIKMTDKKIDNLVYELYGLTEEEIDIVEESLKGN